MGAVRGEGPSLALVPLDDGGIVSDLRHQTTGEVGAGWGEAFGTGGETNGGRRTRSRRRDGSRAGSDGRPRDLVRISVRGREGFETELRAEQTRGMGVALEDHPALGHEVPRHVFRADRVRDGAPPLVGQRARGARGGREGAGARSPQRPGLLPRVAGSGLEAGQGTPAARGIRGARIDQADDPVLRDDGDAGTGSDRGAERVWAGASLARPYAGRGGRGSGWGGTGGSLHR